MLTVTRTLHLEFGTQFRFEWRSLGQRLSTAVVTHCSIHIHCREADCHFPGCGYTLGMKTAVSIPNDVFEGAERLARRTRRSRSRLFSDALREYLARHTPDNVTELMDKALTQIGAEKDTFVSSAAGRTLREIEW